MPNTTHIVTMNCTTNDLKEYTRYKRVQIVNTSFLTDCLIYRSKVKEDDFCVNICDDNVPTANKTQDSKENFLTRQLSNDFQNNSRRVTGFNGSNKEDTWNGASRYSRHYDSGSKKFENPRNSLLNIN